MLRPRSLCRPAFDHRLLSWCRAAQAAPSERGGSAQLRANAHWRSRSDLLPLASFSRCGFPLPSSLLSIGSWSVGDDVTSSSASDAASSRGPVCRPRAHVHSLESSSLQESVSARQVGGACSAAGQRRNQHEGKLRSAGASRTICRGGERASRCPPTRRRALLPSSPTRASAALLCSLLHTPLHPDRPSSDRQSVRASLLILIARTTPPLLQPRRAHQLTMLRPSADFQQPLLLQPPSSCASPPSTWTAGDVGRARASCRGPSAARQQGGHCPAGPSLTVGRAIQMDGRGNRAGTGQVERRRQPHSPSGRSSTGSSASRTFAASTVRALS